MSAESAWQALRLEALGLARVEPLLAGVAHRLVLDRDSFADAVAELLSGRLASDTLSPPVLRGVVVDALRVAPGLLEAAALDLRAAQDRDPAAMGIFNPFANQKGFQALQAQRISHVLWNQGRRTLALALNGLVSRSLAVDIHPGARMGVGIFIDHATGVVIGETAVVGDDVSMLQGVTLGGTGKDAGDRHPKIGSGVLLSAGSTVLGNIRIGDGAKIGAGSVVLDDVPARMTVVGVPGRIVGPVQGVAPALTMKHEFE